MAQNTNITSLIKHQIQKEESFPVLSPEAIKIQTEATKKNPHFSVLASLIRKDPTLTSQVLKIANSPFYRGVKEAETLKDGLMRLGQDEMVNIIMKVIHQQNFGSKNITIRSYQEKLWHHSVSCAMGSLWTARYLSLKELIPKAFIAGLLHDMGKLYILTAMEKILDSQDTDITPFPGWIDGTLATLHPELGYNLLKEWCLPEQYRTISRDHHAQKYPPSDLLLVIVRLVNTLCLEMEKEGQATDLSIIFNSKEAKILKIPETAVMELKIVIEDVTT